MNLKNKKIYQRRREDFAKELPDNSTVILPNKQNVIRSNDVEYKFKADCDFYYLTGFEEPNSVCVIKKDKKSFSYILFVEEENKQKEIWIGKISGTRGAKTHFGADQSYPYETFESKIKEIVKGSENIYYPIGKNKNLDLKVSTIVNELRLNNRSGAKAPTNISDPREIIHSMRLYKDSHEIECMQKAADISSESHITAMKNTKIGMYEYELEALIEYNFRLMGSCGPSYPSIVGSGKNATTLHYINNNKIIKKNDLILIDAGCEFENYASDLTRTFPAGKKFTSEQKDIYEIVLETQLKCINSAKAGKTFKDIYNKSVDIITDGLKELKILKGSKSEIIKNGKYKKFYMHNIGHWLGLDVHDAGPYIKDGKSIKLKPGMVLTVEPGIYIPSDEETPKNFRGIGIRIEDDVLITKSGNYVLTHKAPKKIKDIESLRS